MLITPEAYPSPQIKSKSYKISMLNIAKSHTHRENEPVRTYSYIRHTNYIHIPLIVFTTTSPGHSLIAPTLSNSKPFYWKGYRFSEQKRIGRSNSGMDTQNHIIINN